MNFNSSSMQVRYVTQQLSHVLLLFLFVSVCSCADHPFPEARKHSIDEKALEAAFIHARTIVDLQGLAVARDQVIVAEEYYGAFGPAPDSNLHIMSVTKSITATLIGIAIEQGYITSVEQKLGEFLGDEIDSLNPALAEVTIDQLLTMTAGQDWHELGGDSEFSSFVSAPNQLNYIFKKPVVNTPGTVFNYSDGAAHLVSVILTKATGMSLSEFANENLFVPMGIGERLWYTDKQAYSYGGVGLCLGIHDMIKIGELYLQNGMYNNQQIVSALWLQEVCRFHISTNKVIPFLSDYGYFWWIGEAHGSDFICANGYGGQFIFVVKELNLVVCARTNYRGIGQENAGENWYRVLDLIINQILPAIN